MDGIVEHFRIKDSEPFDTHAAVQYGRGFRKWNEEDAIWIAKDYCE